MSSNGRRAGDTPEDDWISSPPKERASHYECVRRYVKQQNSGTKRVECPNCQALRAITPRNGILRYPPHDKRKTRTSTTSRRWARIDSTWKVVGS